MLKLTKEIIKEMKDCRYISIHRDRAGLGDMSLTFEDTIRGQVVDSRKSYLVEALLSVNEKTDYGNGNEVLLARDPKNSYCSWGTFNYPGMPYELNTQMSLLKPEDEIKFEFQANNGGNLHTDRAGLHGDRIVMHIYRKGTKVGQILLDERFNPGDSARIVNPTSNMSYFKINPTDRKYANRQEEAV